LPVGEARALWWKHITASGSFAARVHRFHEELHASVRRFREHRHEARLGKKFRLFLDGIRKLPATTQLERVNAWVNWNIRYKSDYRHWHKKDQWSHGLDTLKDGAGDCEDYSILKALGLAYLGINAKRLHLVVGFLNWRSGWVGHAILAVEIKPKQYYIMDNTRKHVVLAPLSDFRALYTIDVGGLWLARNKKR
jgi:predicted transglutaminase-like cysteine proteinase